MNLDGEAYQQWRKTVCHSLYFAINWIRELVCFEFSVLIDYVSNYLISISKIGGMMAA